MHVPAGAPDRVEEFVHVDALALSMQSPWLETPKGEADPELIGGHLMKEANGGHRRALRGNPEVIGGHSRVLKGDPISDQKTPSFQRDADCVIKGTQREILPRTRRLRASSGTPIV